MDYIIIGLLVAAIILLLALLFKKPKADKETAERLKESEERLRDEFARGRNENAREVRALGEKINADNAATREMLMKQGNENLKNQNEMQERLFTNLSRQSENINDTLQKNIENLQKSNEQKLDLMRETVDEKLTSTLTKRLDSSFQTVGEQLKAVHESVGEMKKIAGDVGDLQRVLTNVKARGTWAEVQLGNILEQTLPPDTFERNVSVKNNSERVEYAVKIPSRDRDGTFVWLPIDSKFPQEDYIRLCDAAEKADSAAVEESVKSLERTVKKQAETIAKLYIEVPKTTDFAVMFLPTEGLYAEVLRRPGLAEEMQTKYHIMIAGPTTITAFLNTLQMGFRTIAIDKRASEVWKLLGAVKSQYGEFETVLAKVKKKIDEAGNTIESAQKRNGIILKKLKTVEQIDTDESKNLLELDGAENEQI